MKHTREELSQLQGLPLSIKIRMTENRIREWIREYGEDGVYISFSGGKDSTVLMDIIRNRMEYNIPAVFVDVPTQYPELRDFAKTFDNVTVLKPKISFMEVCEKYGFPLISKEVSECVQGARKYLTSILQEQNTLTDRQTDRAAVSVLVRQSYWNGSISEQEEPGNTTYTNTKRTRFLERADRESMRNPSGGGTITSIANSEELASMMRRDKGQRIGEVCKSALLLGMLTTENDIQTAENIPSEDRSMFSQEKYKFFLDAPFEISNRCCDVMKKEPAKRYGKQTGRVPITAQMASESRLRTQKWLEHGCNAFDQDRPISNPMSFWTEQDVLLYIKSNDLPICSVYGEVVSDDEESGQLDLKAMTGMELFDLGNVPLHTTGCDRTGCMLCGFGCHLEKYPSRFERLKETHPGMYGLLDKVKNSGVTFREAIEWTNEHGNLRIRL